ncbi:hypothetical protein BDZ45DRAFT_671503 [Acephala macrosclerotiorum]|nr:hypothetical protein BDZ45DRAFT_671503 [Acephala macrosclerotiorum]
MPTQFDDLPFEIREEIFHTAFIAQWQPRVVEIFFKDGEIYSKTRPPPLLQVCQLSRDVALKYYKPWLPQFAGTLAHQPYEDLVEERGWEDLSRLHNVCIDLHYDILVINTQQWSPWDFGTLERDELRTLAVNLGGWVQWLTTPKLAQQFTNLRRLALFDGTKDSEMLLYKRRQIEREIDKQSWKGKIAPRVDLEDIPVALEWERDIKDWITYKYPDKSRSSRSRADDDHVLLAPIRRETTTQRAREEYKRYRLPLAHNTSAEKAQGGRTSRTNSSVRATTTTSSGIISKPSHPPRKRARDDYEEIQPPNASRKASKKSHGRQVPVTILASCSNPSLLHIHPTKVQPRKFIVPQIQDMIEPPRESSSPSRTVQEAHASIWEGPKRARSPTPEIRPESDTTRSSFIHFEEDLLVDLVDLCSSVPEARPTPLVRPAPECPGSPITKFMNPFEDWDDLEMGITQEDLRAELPRTSSPVIDLTDEALVFQSQAELVNLTDDGEYGNDLLALDWTQSTATEPDNNSIETVQLEDLEIESTWRVGSQPDESSQNHELWTSSLPAIQDEEQQYAVERILEERTTLEGVQFLVQWEGYPDEKDQTWSSENLIIQIAPDLVMARMLSKNDDEPEAEVEGEAEVLQREPVFERDVEIEADIEASVEEAQARDERSAGGNEREVEPEVEVAAKVVVELAELEVINADDIPERILGKKKFKGVSHYLVKWKGYELVKDRTWEPCERLGADVPWLVEIFEAKKGRKKKR